MIDLTYMSKAEFNRSMTPADIQTVSRVAMKVDKFDAQGRADLWGTAARILNRRLDTADGFHYRFDPRATDKAIARRARRQQPGR
jgi:hypothetical protein